jgi:hypothetical protein
MVSNSKIGKLSFMVIAAFLWRDLECAGHLSPE